MHSDQRHDERQERQAQKLLAEAGSMLASPLEYGATLAAVAELAVRTLADICVIDIIDRGDVRRVEAAHADPAFAEATEELRRFPLDRNRPHMSLAALETRQPVLVPEVTPAVLDVVTQGPEHRRVLQSLAPRSFMAVPLLARDRLLGIVLFISSHQNYGADDLDLAKRLVQFAGLEVDNARLYEEARIALRARDSMLGVVAHDLRNPLNTITMGAQLLLHDAVPAADRSRQLHVILRSAELMSRLIQDLLDVARLEANGLTLHYGTHAPAEIVSDALEMYVGRAEAKQISLEANAADELPAISCDRDRLLQLLSNLIGNAIRFTAEAGHVTVSAVAVGDHVRFTVADDGIGIAPADLPRLFEPFWQGTDRGGDGAGLGLAIARGIVEAHKGTIRAHSEVGSGSTFAFTIPTGRPNA